MKRRVRWELRTQDALRNLKKTQPWKFRQYSEEWNNEGVRIWESKLQALAP